MIEAKYASEVIFVLLTLVSINPEWILMEYPSALHIKLHKALTRFCFDTLIHVHIWIFVKEKQTYVRKEHDIIDAPSKTFKERSDALHCILHTHMRHGHTVMLLYVLPMFNDGPHFAINIFICLFEMINCAFRFQCCCVLLNQIHNEYGFVTPLN